MNNQGFLGTPGTGCPVCGYLLSVPVLVKNGYTIVRCKKCDVWHVSPIPSAESLSTLYEDPNYFSGSGDSGYFNYMGLRKVLIPKSRRRLGVINSLMPRGRLLDFGCAAGYFLEVAQADDWQIAGVELSPRMAESAARALHIPIAPSLSALPEGDFHVITLWEVIEHLPQPVAELQHLHDRLRPGGLLMLSTPNAGHWQAVREPEGWNGYCPPSHLLFFTQQTLEDALRRAGFERIAVHKVAPLPPLPGWLRRMSTPLQHSVSIGQARFWPVALFSWRAIRGFGWAWQRIMHPNDDVFTTLEAIAFRPR